MLTPEQLQNIPENIIKDILILEEKVIKDISKNIARGIRLGESKYQVKRMLRLGYDAKKLEDRLRKEIQKIADKTETLILDVGEFAYGQDKDLYMKGGKVLEKYQNNAHIQTLVNEYATSAKDDMLSISKMAGLRDKDNVYSVSGYARKSINQGILQVHTGLYTYDDAIKQALKDIYNHGLVSEENNRKYDVYSKVRSTILNHANQLSNNISEYNIKTTGVDLVETTAHPGARTGDGINNHAEWQGQVFSYTGNHDKYPDFYESTGYGELLGLGGINCRHGFFPFFEGISERAYTGEDLDNIDPKPIEWEGKMLDAYQCTQMQRYYERNIRRIKRQYQAYEGADLEEKDIIKIRGSAIMQQYRTFSKKAGLTVKYNRLSV